MSNKKILISGTIIGLSTLAYFLIKKKMVSKDADVEDSASVDSSSPTPSVSAQNSSGIKGDTITMSEYSVAPQKTLSPYRQAKKDRLLLSAAVQ